MLEKKPVMSRLRSAMRSAGVRNVDLATECGISPQAVGQWFKTGRVSKENLAKAAAMCRVSLEWLLRGGEPREAGNSNSPPGPPLTLSIPLLSSFASMGLGFPIQDHETVIDNLRLSQDWCRRNLNVSNLGNLAALSAYGDSMRPTFDDGDILIVDRGVAALTVDAVYVLQFRDELYVKRIQRRPDGTVVIRSDNALYEPMVIDPANDGLRVLGRVVWAWNGRKL